MRSHRTWACWWSDTESHMERSEFRLQRQAIMGVHRDSAVCSKHGGVTDPENGGADGWAG